MINNGYYNDNGRGNDTATEKENALYDKYK